MSQEIRSHMNSIVGFSFLLEENCSCRENQGYSDQILSSCKQLIWFIESILDTAMIDKNDTQVNLKRCNLGNLLEESISEIRGMLSNNNKKIDLISDNQFSDLSEVFIDSIKVNRIIQSLVQNAINNSKSGYVKVGYHLCDEEVTFYVHDSGQDHIKFEEFLNSDDIDGSLTKFFDTSSALNIILVKKIIQVLGGTIWVDCHDLTGTAVYFSIPAKVVKSSDISTNKYVNTSLFMLNL